MRNYIPRGPTAWPPIVFLLTRAPRTRQELCEMTGARYDTCSRVIKLLEEEGLVTQSENRGRAKVWQWSS